MDLAAELKGIRLQAFLLYKHSLFDGFILFCIAVNCVAMACDDPVSIHSATLPPALQHTVPLCT